MTYLVFILAGIAVGDTAAIFYLSSKIDRLERREASDDPRP